MGEISERAGREPPAEPMEQAVLYWSGGKDCALALHALRTDARFQRLRVTSLLTTFTRGYDRVSDHGTRRALVECQAEALGLALHETYIPQRATMAQYERVIETALGLHRAAGVGVAVAGDIFVEKGRVATLAKVGLRGCFPLWNRTTREHIRAFLASGIRAYVVCVDSAVLDPSFVGQPLDEALVARLPPHVDPCGENGEFHTVAVDGPMFRAPIRCRLGEVVLRESLYFSDVIPL